MRLVDDRGSAWPIRTWPTRFRRDQIGMIFPFFKLLDDLTVADNVLLPAQLARMRRAKARVRVAELLASCHHSPGTSRLVRLLPWVGRSRQAGGLPGPFGTSLLGLVKHLTRVEIAWSQYAFAGADVWVPGDDLAEDDDPQSVIGDYQAAVTMSNQIVALHVTMATAKTHVGRLLAKPGARDRAQLVMVPYETGLVQAGSQGGEPGPFGWIQFPNGAGACGSDGRQTAPASKIVHSVAVWVSAASGIK